MGNTNLVLVVAIVLLAGLGLVARGAERYVGWRYLYQPRRSRAVGVATFAAGAVTAALIAAFLAGHWGESSTGHALLVPGILAAAITTASIVFLILLLLNFFSVFTTIAITGVFFGVRALIVVLSVTSGFQASFQEKVLGVNAHVLVLKYGFDFDNYRDVEKKAAALPHVTAVAPFIFHEMLLAHDAQTAGVLVKGIQPGVSDKVLDINQWLEDGASTSVLAQTQPVPSILVGKELAKRLKVKVGDRVRVISPLADSDPSLWSSEARTPELREFRIGGIFYSGFDEYDRRLVCIDLAVAQKFVERGDKVTGIELKTDDVDKSGAVAAALDRMLNPPPTDGSEPVKDYRVMDWRDLNHNLFTALEMQKYLLAILLTVIVVVASFGVLGTLTMLVVDKTREIAILKSIGMRSRSVARVFQIAGLTIGLVGSVAGILSGLLDCTLVAHYHYRLDPRVYLIDKLPVHVHPVEVLLTAAVTLAICFVATLYPSRRAASLRPVEGLRYE